MTYRVQTLTALQLHRRLGLNANVLHRVDVGGLKVPALLVGKGTTTFCSDAHLLNPQVNPSPTIRYTCAFDKATDILQAVVKHEKVIDTDTMIRYVSLHEAADKSAARECLYRLAKDHAVVHVKRASNEVMGPLLTALMILGGSLVLERKAFSSNNNFTRTLTYHVDQAKVPWVFAVYDHSFDPRAYADLEHHQHINTWSV